MTRWGSTYILESVGQNSGLGEENWGEMQMGVVLTTWEASLETVGPIWELRAPEITDAVPLVIVKAP